MDAWLNGMQDLFFSVFGRTSPAETYTVIALCILFGALALSSTGTALGATGAFYTTGIFLTAAGLILISGAMVLPSVFGFHSSWMPLMAAVAALLAVVLPVTMLFQKGGYIAALIAWTLALLTVGVILTLEPMAMRTIEKGAAKAHQIENRRIETERFK